jgi:hypothetical protein
MMRKLTLCCLFLLVACGIPPRATPLPTPSVIRIAYTPFLEPLVKALHSCAAAQTDVMITITEVPTPELDVNKVDLIFRLGGAPGKAYSAVIRDQSIVFVVNSDNPVLALSTAQIHDLFTGRITTWDELGGKQQPIQVWVYPEAEDIRQVFDSAIFPGESLTTKALLAPDPQAMLDAVADDPAAIGYISETWLVQPREINQVRALDINPKLAELLRQPVLALSSAEPVGSLRQFLVCMQSASQ